MPEHAPQAAAESPRDFLAALPPVVRDNPETVARIVAIFIKQLELTVARVDAAISAGDARAVMAEAHGVKGAAGVMALRELGAAADALELAAADGRLHKADAVVAAFRSRAATTIDDLRAVQCQPALVDCGALSV